MQHAHRFMDNYEFSIRIYPQSYFKLSLINHKNLTVFEEKTVIIDSTSLLVEHSELKADQIIYRIVEKPKYGQITNSKSDLSDMVRWRDGQNVAFSQADINSGYIAYRQNVKFNLDPYDPSQYWDRLVFDVGNQVISLENQTLFVQVV